MNESADCFYGFSLNISPKQRRDCKEESTGNRFLSDLCEEFRIHRKFQIYVESYVVHTIRALNCEL